MPSDQVVVINGSRTDQSVISIPQGTYDIETIITMLNASDSLFEVVYSGENAFRVYNQFVIPTLTQLIHSLNKAIHLSRCVCGAQMRSRNYENQQNEEVQLE